MYIPNFPEDSTLRRHYESAAAFRRQARLAQPPTDSVLRRHYEQLHQAAVAPVSAAPSPVAPAAATPSAVTPAAATPSPVASAAPTTTPSAPSGQPSSGGFFGWLKRLFS